MPNKIYGYCRCSTNATKQDITRQIKELKDLGVVKDNIFTEYESGTKIDRIELKRLLSIVENGDTIISTEVSRITRSTTQLCKLIELAKNKKLKLIFGNFTLDCTGNQLDPMTEGMVKMMGVFSELERNMTSARVKSGLAHAKSKGTRLGRPKLTSANIPFSVKKNLQLYIENKITKVEFATMCSITRPTLDKYIQILKGLD